MRNINGDALLFDADDVRATTALLPRLFRNFAYGYKITNEDYKKRYWSYFQERFRGLSKKVFGLKSSSNRIFIADKNKITYNLFSSVVDAMGFDITSISMTVTDRLTGEVRTFSTLDSVEDLDRQDEAKNKIGIDSL